ncbi:MAG: ion transporter [Sulfurimonas sp.]|nr:ion transporter [Sulfurimonas sp.]
MLKRLIINIAYSINTSAKYARIKTFFYNLLENSNYKYKKYFDLFMITLIFASVIILVREVKSEVSLELLFFNNYIVSFIFFIEYMLRLWVISSVTKIIIEQSEHDAMLGENFQLLKTLKEVSIVKFKYILSMKAIIDLLAIIPFFHELRLLRIFILFRVFKLFRYTKSIQTFTSVIAAKKFEFLTLLIFASIIIFVSSVLIYVMEGNNPDSPIDTLFEAVYWSIVTISTVGYGDITPTTEAGRFVAMFVIVAGIAVFSFTTSLIVTAFTEKLDEIKDIKMIDDVSKLKEFYLICGYSSVAKEVAKKLSKNSKVIILDEQKNMVEEASKDGFIALNYDPGSIDSYKKLRIKIDTQVKTILCLSHSDVKNVYTALTVRSFNKDIFILSVLINETSRNKLKFAGVNELIYEKELVGMIAKEFIGKPVAFEAIHALRSNLNGIDIQEIVINERVLSSFTTVGEIKNRKYRVILLGIYKKTDSGFLFNPQDSILLEKGDLLLVIGNVQFISDFNKYLHKKGNR